MLMAKYNGLTKTTRIQDMLGWVAMCVTVTEALGSRGFIRSVDPETDQPRKPAFAMTMENIP